MSDEMKEDVVMNEGGLTNVTQNLPAQPADGIHPNTRGSDPHGAGDVGDGNDPEKNVVGNAEDIATNFLQSHHTETPFDKKEVRRVLWKIDFLLMPLMFLTYMFNYTDKLLLSTGANFGLVQDLGLFVEVEGGKTDTSRYSNASTIYYVSFLLGVPVMGYLAQRYPVGKVCSAAVTAWGIVAALTAVCSNYAGTMVQRTALGFAESGILPCFVVLTASFYTKYEQTLRVAIWYAGASGSFPLTTAINYGLLHINGSIPGWKILYVFWGSATAAWGLMCFWILPDTPMQAWNLNERQRYIATERLRMNQSGVANRHFKRSQVVEALLDPKVWLPGLIAFCITSANSMQSVFNPILFKHLLHASSYRSMVLGIPDHLVTAVVTIGAGVVTTTWKNTNTATSVSIQLLCFIGAVTLWKVDQDNKNGLFAGIYLMSCFLGALSCIYGFVTANIAGHTKKTIASAWLIINVNAANAAAPQFFKSEDAPKYTHAFIGITILFISSIAMTLFYSFLSWKENRRRDALGEVAQTDRAFMDLTDKENLTFRYIL